MIFEQLNYCATYLEADKYFIWEDEEKYNKDIVKILVRYL